MQAVIIAKTMIRLDGKAEKIDSNDKFHTCLVDIAIFALYENLKKQVVFTIMVNKRM